STLIVFGLTYKSHPSTSSPSVPIAVFTFRACFASYQYPHFRTLCSDGQTVIKARVGMKFVE
ncbi:MAG: hypothetical protein WBF29_08840, partial [Syntrophobacteria bacterium]